VVPAFDCYQTVVTAMFDDIDVQTRFFYSGNRLICTFFIFDFQGKLLMELQVLILVRIM